MPEIIADPAAVTPAWLTEVLGEAGHDGVVRSFEAGNVGTGQVGQNVRFALTYASGSGPDSIVGKFASSDPVSRQTGVSLLNYLREVRFYQELRASLDVQTPKVLFTDVDAETHDFCLMMEDLAPAEQGDQLAGCSVDEAGLAIEELAKLHGPRWGDPALLDYEWLSRPDPEQAPEENMVVALWNTLLPGFLERYGPRLTDREVAIAKALGERFVDYATPRGDALTVTHGDFRLDNMLFGGPYPLAVVDWQSPAAGTAAADVAYFMGTSLPTEARREAEQQLVSAYHGRLLDYGVADYDLDSLWADYRRGSFAGLVMAVIASMIVGQTDRGDDMFMAMGKRSAAMADDLDALDLLEVNG